MIFTSQELRRSAAGNLDGPARITILPTSSSLNPGDYTLADLYINSGSASVTGVQIILYLTGNFPTDFKFIPNQVTGLNLLTNTLTQTSTGYQLSLVFLAPFDANLGGFAPFSSQNQPAKLGAFAFTNPTVGQLNFTFDKTFTKIEDASNQVNLAGASDLTYTFAPIATPVPTPTPVVTSIPTTTPDPTSSPSPTEPPTSTEILSVQEARLTRINSKLNRLTVSVKSSLGNNVSVSVTDFGTLSYKNKDQAFVGTFATRDIPQSINIVSSGGGSLTTPVSY